MPETTISTPEHTAAITRMTLGVTSARETSAPSFLPSISCSASEDE